MQFRVPILVRLNPEKNNVKFNILGLVIIVFSRNSLFLMRKHSDTPKTYEYTMEKSFSDSIVYFGQYTFYRLVCCKKTHPDYYPQL